jgi:hypothetical protein
MADTPGLVKTFWVGVMVSLAFLLVYAALNARKKMLKN